MQEDGRGMEGGGSIGKGWMAGGTGMEEMRQGRKEEARQSAKEEEKQAGRKPGRRKKERVGPSNESEQ